MREVSPKVIGSVVMVTGAIVALAAGVLIPALNAPAKALRGHAASVAAQPAPPSARQRLRPVKFSGAVAAAAAAPADADMVLVVEHAADLRQSPVGDAAVRFFLDSTAMAPTREAWSELAVKLGWDQTELFDRLLGGRVVLVVRGLGDLQNARWALLSDVSTETDQRLKERLEAAQRSIDNGHQVLAIEKGKYELTSHHRGHGPGRADAASTPDADRVTFVLGPAGRSELFDEMVGVLARGADDPLAGRDVIAAAQNAGAPEILMLARLAPAKDEPPPPAAATDQAQPADRWADFCILSGGRKDIPPARAQGVARTAEKPEDSDFLARVVYRDRREREANLRIQPASDGVFRAIEPGSLLAIVQAAPVQQILGDRFQFADLLRDLPLAESAERLMAARKVFALCEVPASSHPSADPPSADPSSADFSPTHIAGVLALETTSASALAPIMDGSIARFIKEREQQIATGRPPPHDFGGSLPAITRLLPLTALEGSPLKFFVPDPLTLAWSFPRSAGSGGDGEDAAGPGWWVMSITPSFSSPASPPASESLPELAHRAAVSILTRTDRAPAPESIRRWIWLGALRPAAVESRLPSPALLPDVGGFRSAMKRFERIAVELSINDEGDIQGDLVARLAEIRAK